MRILLLATFIASPAAAEDLTVTLESLRAPKGKIVLCLWNTPSKFPDCDAGQPVQRITIEAADAGKPVVFKDVPAGTIALSAFHDENGNGKFDTNFIGLPLEGTAASNNAKPRMGPPSYKAASIRFTSSTAIRLRFFYL